jgi:hypothetical protein
MRLAATVMLMVALGCSGPSSNQFSPPAVPIALKLLDAVNSANSSTVGGQMERARELYNNRVITEKDFQILLQVADMASLNQWNDAKKVLQESMPPRG